ncbi:MAG: TetR/AcrR family transcriptional regulator [Homoserinimonas sp.]
MAREADASRKPLLLAQILEYLLDKPLATLSFRRLAKALDVSTFTLVYHFGSRAQLLSDIVWAISAREQDIQKNLSENPGTIDAYFDGLDRSWEWSVQPRNQNLLRLEFEASMMEAQDPTSHTFTRELYAHWQKIGLDALQAIGLSKADAELESRLTVDSIFGIQYDLVINQDIDRATAAFRHMLAAHRARVEALAGPD